MPKKLKNNPQEQTQDNEKILGRVLAFSDAVFAFAMTLLVLDLRVPEDTPTESMGDALKALWPNYWAFLLSFLVIGLYWFAHLRLYREIVRYDQTLILMNLLLMLFIVLIPFSTSLLGVHFVPATAIIYAAIMAATGYVTTGLRLYSGYKQRLVSNFLELSYIRKRELISLVAPVGFTVSICIVFINLGIVQLFWGLILLASLFTLRLVKNPRL